MAALLSQMTSTGFGINGHPLVGQDSENTDPATDPGTENVDEHPSNNTNPLGYPFQDYHIYENIRAEWGAFLFGMNADFFAANASTCFSNTLNLIQYDVELLMVKLMYGSAKNNVLNTTLFLKNVSDLNYICLDAAENSYVFWVYKID